MKKQFAKFYNFLRDTSLIFVLLLLVSTLFLANNARYEQKVMATMGYELIGFEEETVFSVQHIPSSPSINSAQGKTIAIKVQNGMGYIQLSDIHFVTMSDGNPVIVLENKDSLYSRLTLTKLYEQFDELNPSLFFRTKSEIFPIAQIQSITSKPIGYGNSNGTQYSVKLKGGVSFPLSDQRFKELKAKLNNF